MERKSVAARPVPVRRALQTESMQSTVARKNLTQMAVTRMPVAQMAVTRMAVAQMAVAQMLSSRERPAPRAAVSWSLKCPLVNSRLMVVVSHRSGQVVCARQPRQLRQLPRELSLECGWNAAVAECHLTERREWTTRQATILRVQMSRRHQRALVDSQHPHRSKSRRAYGCARGRGSVRAAYRLRLSRTQSSRTESSRMEPVEAGVSVRMPDWMSALVVGYPDVAWSGFAR